MADLFDLTSNLLGIQMVTLQYEGRAATFELLKLDAAISESHAISARITDHEVEDGSNISDHKIDSPDTLDITGVISENPISLAEAAVTAGGGVVGSLVPGIGGAVVTGAVSKVGSSLVQEEEGGRFIRAWQALEFAKREAIPLTIITGLKTYTNMILMDANNTRTARNSQALEFTAKFKNVRIIESETVTVPVTALDDDVEGKTKKRNEGKKPIEDPGDKEGEKGASLLSQLTGIGA
jgi:hypothetical protein